MNRDRDLIILGALIANDMVFAMATKKAPAEYVMGLGQSLARTFSVLKRIDFNKVMKEHKPDSLIRFFREEGGKIKKVEIVQ